MEEDVMKLKRKLLDAVDRNHNVRDPGSITEVLEVLENIEVDEKLLRSTRLGKIVNDLRRQLKDETLARRAKQLVKRWRNYVVLRAGGAVASGTRMDSVAADSADNYVDGKETSHEWTANENLKTNCDSKISKEHCSRLGTSGNATRSSSVQEQEPAGEVFENKMRNDSLNRFVEGKCKNLASSIRASKDMVVTMNPQDWDTTKVCPVTDSDKSGSEQIVYRGQKPKINVQFSCSTKTALVPTNFTPRKKVKTTQELIKTVLSNSDLPQEGVRNCREHRIVSQTDDREHIKSCELKLPPRGAIEPSYNPTDEDHPAPLKDSNNEGMKEGTFAEFLSTPAQSTVNHEGTIIEEMNLSENPEDACQNESMQEVQCGLTVSAHVLNMTESSVVRFGEGVTDSAYEDVNCSTSFVKIEGVTGLFDEGPRRNGTDEGFREWHECLSKRSYKGEFLGILPYVVID